MKKKVYKNDTDESLDKFKNIDFLIEEENKDLEYILFLIIAVLFTKSDDIKPMYLSGCLTAFTNSMRKTSEIDYLIGLKDNLKNEFLVEIENAKKKNVDYYKRKLEFMKKERNLNLGISLGLIPVCFLALQKIFQDNILISALLTEIYFTIRNYTDIYTIKKQIKQLEIFDEVDRLNNEMRLERIK